MASQSLRLMLRKLAMLDQYTADRARGESSMIGEEASMKNAKSALEHLSQLEQKVEEAVVLTSKGEVIAKKGGPLRANTWWDGMPATDVADCSTWTHLEVAKQQLNAMKMQVRTHTMEARIYGIRSLTAGKIMTRRDTFKSDLATAVVPLDNYQAALASSGQQTSVELAKPSELAIQLTVEQAQSHQRRQYQEDRFAMMQDSLKAERETCKLVQAQSEHEMRVLKIKMAKLAPAAKKAKFAPESVQKLIDVAVLEATKARDAKMNAEKIYQANQKEFLSAGNATEGQMYQDIKSAEASEHVVAKAEEKAKLAEAKLAAALDEIERKRMSADIGVALIKEEMLLQRRLVHSTKQRIIHADMHIKVQAKAEKSSSATFIQGSRAQALMLQEFHAVNRRWEDETLPGDTHCTTAQRSN
jgi:hypothetical protein